MSAPIFSFVTAALCRASILAVNVRVVYEGSKSWWQYLEAVWSCQHCLNSHLFHGTISGAQMKHILMNLTLKLIDLIDRSLLVWLFSYSRTWWVITCYWEKKTDLQCASFWINLALPFCHSWIVLLQLSQPWVSLLSHGFDQVAAGSRLELVKN